MPDVDFTTRLPRSLYLSSQVQQLDKIAIEQFKIPAFELMQVAAGSAFSNLRETWPHIGRIEVWCGGGNNAGDGYVVAALAVDAGLGALAIAVADPKKLIGSAAKAFRLALSRGVKVLTLDEYEPQPENKPGQRVIVDALFGTGLARDVEGDYATAIDIVNRQGQPILAIDVPSGLSADTGRVMGCAVRANLTVTFIGLKIGLLTGVARDYVGRLNYDSLDLPDKFFCQEKAPTPVARRLDINHVSRLLPPRARTSHKGNNGHVLILGGDHNYGGAVIMAAEAAARAGAGLVSVITRSCHRNAALARRPELMIAGTEDESVDTGSLLQKARVIVIGPGLGRSGWARDLLRLALAAQRARSLPLVIDADGLQLLAELAETQVQHRRDTWILTPHPGEAAVLLDTDTKTIQSDRLAAVMGLASRWGGHCLLKGSGSLICSDHEAQKEVYLCTEGNPGMGSAGMGDVLSGLIAGLLAQGLPPRQALCCATAVHGEAADQAAAVAGERGLMATDLFPFIHQLVNPPSDQSRNYGTQSLP